MITYRFYFLTVFILAFFVCDGQKLKTIKKNYRSPYSYKVQYQVLKNDKEIKNGLYKKMVNNKLVIAGNYKNNQKVDVWQAFDHNGKIYYSYNYSKDTLLHYKEPSDYYKDEQLDNPPILQDGPLAFLTCLYSNVKYPSHAREKRIEGAVYLKLIISESGIVKNWDIFSSDHEALNQGAIQAIEIIYEHLKFIPARKDGIDVESFFIVPIRFRLA